MHPEIQEKINELHAALIAHGPWNAVSFCMSVNSFGTTVEFDLRSPEQLKQAGVTMRSFTTGKFID